MLSFIDEHRAVYGVESLCKVLPIAPSTYYADLACKANPLLRSDRSKRDEQLCGHIKQVWDKSHQLYGARKVWHQLLQNKILVARCTVERLMKRMGLQGVLRGKRVRTTQAASARLCPLDKVNRQFNAPAPNKLWVSDFTYVPTKQGFVYVAFIVDAFARRIVGWKVSRNMRTDFVLDALEQALYERNLNQGKRDKQLIHHSDRGVQYVSFCYTNRLVDAGIEPSVGSVGDAYDNALAETINGLYKTEVIYRGRAWDSLTQVELATLKWVHWFNHQRLLSSIGYVAPAQAEKEYYQKMRESALMV